MANAMVENLKGFGIRHGEKIAVGLAGVLCLVFLGKALVTKAPIETTPDQIKQEATTAQQRITQSFAPEVVEEKLVEEGLRDVDLTELVKNEESNKLRPELFAMTQGWTSQEPGAGLIRETPALLAPREVFARPNRGGLLVYELDKDGNRIPEDPAKAAETTSRRRSRGRSSAMSGYGGYSGEGGGYTSGGLAGRPSAKEEEERKRRERIEDRARAQSLAGSGAAKKQEPETAMPMEPAGPPDKEIVQGRRSVVLTALLDHKGIRENYSKALKFDISSAHPKYLRVDIERQEQRPDGSWTDWSLVDRKNNALVLDNIPEREEELAEPQTLLEGLVDNLPFLRAGYWKGAHRREFVPEEKQTIQRTTPGMAMGGYGGEYGMGGGMSGYGGGEYGMGAAMMPGGGGAMSGGMMPGGGGMMAGGYEGYGGEYGMGGGMMSGGYGMGMGMGGGDVVDYPTSQAPELMIRTIDFTVQPNTTYRYRLRLVVQNPNYSKEMVAPDVDTGAKELYGPFSEPTGEVTVPADLTAYVMRKMPATQGGVDPRSDKIEFRVAKWIEEDGQIVIKPLTYGAGQIIGEPREAVQVPTDGEGIKRERRDLSSHLLIIDAEGGSRSTRSLGIVGPDVEVPAQALLLRPDGSITLRNQARDAADQEMLDVFEAYQVAIRDSEKKREPGIYGGYGGEYGGDY